VSKDAEVFLDGLGFGESPRWHDGRLWFSDFIWHRVSSAGLAGDVRVEVELDDQPSGLGWLPDGRLLVVSMHKRQVLRHEPDGTLAVHADLSDIATGHGNDMVVNSDGTAYVGNFGSDLLAGEVPRAVKLAIVRPDGTVSAGLEDLLVPNGSVITPAGETLIVGESYAQRYTAFPIAADGSLGASRLWADLGPGRNPDGCALDAEGAIWFANCFGHEVVRVLEGGEVTDVIELPETPWACALGGEDGHTLFMIACPVFPTPDHQESGRGRIWAAPVDVPHAGLP
jgi:sugar lactone lactonase YvrE